MLLLNIRKLKFWQVKLLFTPLISVLVFFCIFAFLNYLFYRLSLSPNVLSALSPINMWKYIYVTDLGSVPFCMPVYSSLMLLSRSGVRELHSVFSGHPLRLHLWLVFCFGQAMVRAVWAVLRLVSAGRAARISNVPGRCASVLLRPTSPVVAPCRSPLSRWVA